MMVWPDGGTGKPHDHPFWSKCLECPAAPGWQQEIAMMLFNPVILALLYILLFTWLM